MKRRKPRYDPRQLSFTFEVMADHIERIREENASEGDIPQAAGQSPEVVPKSDVLRFIKEGEPDNKYFYHTNDG
jgi:hypothetical protein